MGFEEINLISRGANYGWDIREDCLCTRRWHQLQFGRPHESPGGVRPRCRLLDYRRLRIPRRTDDGVGRALRFGDFGGMIASLTPAAGGTVRCHADGRQRRNAGGCAGAIADLGIRQGPTTVSCSRSTIFRGHIYGSSSAPEAAVVAATTCRSNYRRPAASIRRPLAHRRSLRSSRIPSTRPSGRTGRQKERWIGLPNGQNIAVRDQRRLGSAERHCAGEAFPDRHSARRNAAVHASSRRCLGRIHVSVERRNDRRHANTAAAERST